MVFCAHCTGMEGLGEACLHIAVLLFAAEAHTKLNKARSCTSQSCAWLPPAVQKVRFAPISEIDFTVRVTKSKKLWKGKTMDHLQSRANRQLH